jgi:hypothetical protein
MNFGENISYLLIHENRNEMIDIIQIEFKRLFIGDYVSKLYPINIEFPIKMSINKAKYEKK